MLPRAEARPLLALLALVLAPGLTLAYVGLRGVTEHENNLRTQYLATATLVRDRLAAELAARDQELWRAVAASGGVPSSPGSSLTASPWLDALERNRPWLTRMFLIQGDGLATRSLRARWPGENGDPLAASPRAAALVARAETAEFVQGDLESALRQYRAARRNVPPGSPLAAFLLTREGRTLLRMDRSADGIATYRQVLARAGNAIDRPTGLPYAVMALVQIADTLAALGRAAEQAVADRDLLAYVVDHPWDLADGLGAYLARALSATGVATADLVGKGRALEAEVAALEWLQREVGPRIQAASPAVTASDDARGDFVVRRDGWNILVGFRRVRSSDGTPVAVGYVVRPESVAGEMLDGILRSLAVDRGLAVRVTGQSDAAGPLPLSAAPGALAEVPLFSDTTGWRLAIVDVQGRSVTQLVARERWTYGALVVGMLAVMVAGVVLIARTSRRAAELSNAKTEFVANVSHELKTPLALIRMFGETLESGIVPDEDRRREFAGVIRRESERLTHLINNVLDLGRIDAGTKRYELVRGDVVGIVRQALDAYRPLFDRLGFEVEAELPNEPISIRMDRDAIVQALVNLFQNVIKYADQGGHIRVSVARDEDRVRVSVADRGVGISADEIPRIFAPYYRAAATRESAPAGSGLGLSIVQHAIAAHGGRVEVTSTPGAGSTFMIVLPVTPAEATVTSAEATVARAGT